MCLRVCCIFHGIWGATYTGAGSIQLVAGVFFHLYLPIFQLKSNIIAGSIDVLFGVITVMMTCYGPLTPSRSRKLFYITIAVLVTNVVNLTLLEFGEWKLLLTKEIEQKINQNHPVDLVYYARMSTSATTAAVIVLALLDSQLTYCVMDLRKEPTVRYAPTNEAVSDIEYIIPKHSKSRPLGTKHSNPLNQYSQSWVFDSENGYSPQAESPYLKCPPSAPSDYEILRKTQVRVQVDSASEASLGVDRQLPHMESFSAAPSQQASTAASPTPIYECLESLENRPGTKVLRTAKFPYDGFTRLTRDDAQHYASVLKELGRSVVQKDYDLLSPPPPSKQELREPRGSDADFSRELEAALKLIQDLESPNTPSTELNKLSAATTTDDGKPLCLVESGYNSPSNSSDRTGMSYVIRQTPDAATMISLFGEKRSLSVPAGSLVSTPRSMHKVRSVGDLNNKWEMALYKMKRLLSLKRPVLLPELERAILKSESLAFLTNFELEERLRQTKAVHREIEAKVHRALSFRRCESFGSIENVMDKVITQF